AVPACARPRGPEQFQFRTTAAIKMLQVQIVIAGSREIERRQRIAGPAWVGKRHGKVAECQSKSIIAIDAKCPIAGRRNRDHGIARRDKVVDVGTGLSGKQTFAGTIMTMTGPST